jgi:hypothetical protein
MVSAKSTLADCSPTGMPATVADSWSVAIQGATSAEELTDLNSIEHL